MQGIGVVQVCRPELPAQLLSRSFDAVERNGAHGMPSDVLQHVIQGLTWNAGETQAPTYGKRIYAFECGRHPSDCLFF